MVKLLPHPGSEGISLFECVQSSKVITNWKQERIGRWVRNKKCQVCGRVFTEINENKPEEVA